MVSPLVDNIANARVWRPQVLRYLTEYGASIRRVASVLAIPAGAVAGAIAEEYDSGIDDRTTIKISNGFGGRGLGDRWFDHRASVANSNTDAAATKARYDALYQAALSKLQENPNYVPSLGAKVGSKGSGSINLSAQSLEAHDANSNGEAVQANGKEGCLLFTRAAPTNGYRPVPVCRTQLEPLLEACLAPTCDSKIGSFDLPRANLSNLVTRQIGLRWFEDAWRENVGMVPWNNGSKVVAIPPTFA